MNNSEQKQLVIILDSPDRTGKTNIGKALAEHLDIPYFKMTTETENWRTGNFINALRFDQTYILEFLKQTGYSVIIDRGFASEFVYSTVYKRDTDAELLWKLDVGFSDLGAVIIVPLRHDYSQCEKDELVENNMLQSLHNEYINFSEWTDCDTIEMYVDDLHENIYEELQYITTRLKELGKL